MQRSRLEMYQKNPKVPSPRDDTKLEDKTPISDRTGLTLRAIAEASGRVENLKCLHPKIEARHVATSRLKSKVLSELHRGTL